MCNGAVGAFGERFANGLRGARRSRAQRDHFSTVFLFELQRRLERIGIGLVDFKTKISAS